MRRLSVVILLVALAVVPFAGCTGYFDVSGHVYEWTNAPAGAHSQVYALAKPPPEYQLKPVGGAKIVLQDTDKSHVFTLETGTDGYFHLGTTVELREAIGIEVSRAGYQTASGQFGITEAKNFYTADIVLVPGN